MIEPGFEIPITKAVGQFTRVPIDSCCIMHDIMRFIAFRARMIPMRDATAAPPSLEND